MKKYITLFLLLSALTVVSQDNFIEFKKDNYSIKYPENWVLDSTGKMNSSFILFSPETEGDLFKENINLIIQDLTGQGLDLKSYTTISENQIKSMIPNLKWFKNEKVGSHQEIVWSGLVTNNNLKFKQIYYVINDKAYILTFSAHEKVYDDYIKIGNKILESFQVN